MKEQVLASEDELVMGELYPITVSNKRIYIVSQKKKKSKSILTNKVIQLDKVTAIRYSNQKNLTFKTFGIIFLVLMFIILAASVFLYFQNKALLDKIILYLIISATTTFLLSFIFFLLYFLKRIKTIWIEYPTNINNLPTKVIFKKAKASDFNNLIKAIFTSIDKLTQVNEPQVDKKFNFKI